MAESVTHDERDPPLNTFDEIVVLIREQTRFDGPLTPDTALQTDLGLEADELYEFMAEFGRRFAVNLEGFVWYFHGSEDMFNPGGLIFRPPFRRVERIPITVGMLVGFVERGRWDLVYPRHVVPSLPWDIIITWVIFALGAMGTCLATLSWLL